MYVWNASFHGFLHPLFTFKTPPIIFSSLTFKVHALVSPLCQLYQNAMLPGISFISFKLCSQNFVSLASSNQTQLQPWMNWNSLSDKQVIWKLMTWNREEQIGIGAFIRGFFSCRTDVSGDQEGILLATNQAMGGKAEVIYVFTFVQPPSPKMRHSDL